jgi:hypothetical protein
MNFLGRLLWLAVCFVIAAGLLIHFDVEIPGISSWIGRLPGDLILQKGNVTVFMPFTTALLFSGVLTLLGSLFNTKG